MICQPILKKLTDLLTDYISEMESELSKCPQGTLHFETRKGVNLPVKYVNGPKRSRVAMDYDSAELKGYIKAIALRKIIEAEKLNLNVLKATLEKIKDADKGTVIDDINKQFPALNIDLISQSLCFNEFLEWSRAPYEKFSYKEEEKRHKASGNLYVRSKSEALIATMLFNNNIPFRYEAVIKAGGRLLAPDFTIMRSDGKIFYWEHMGLVSNKQYVDQQFQKIRNYYEIGIAPWDNLILTYDDANGNVDIPIIMSEIQNKLLI